MSEPKVTREERLLEVLKILPYLRSKHPLYHEEFDAIRALIREHGPEVSEEDIFNFHGNLMTMVEDLDRDALEERELAYIKKWLQEHGVTVKEGG